MCKYSFVDMHLHTTASDGSDSPAVLIEKAKAQGIAIMSITDHDTLVGIKEALMLGDVGVKIITGIEFSCCVAGDTGFDCHILGYGFDINSDAIARAVNHGREMRLLKLEKRIEYLRDAFGIEFSTEEIQELRSYNSVAKPHLARLIIKHGLADSIADAIDKYLKGIKFPDDRIDASEAIDAIREAGGVSVYAHPLGGERERRLSIDELTPRVNALLRLGIGGLECYYSRYSTEESSALVHLAKDLGLVASAGSDYHGENKTVPLGLISVDGDVVTIEEITLLKALHIE